MSGSRDDIRADLLRWIEQNDGVGPDWFLDEGPVEPLPVAEEDIAAPAEAPAAPAAPAPAGDTRVPAPPAAPAPALQEADIPAPGPAPEIKDPAFKAEVDRFVADTLRLIADQPPHQQQVDPLMPEHGGDPRHALKALQDLVLPCRQCDLAETRTQVVFGAGSAHARVLFIGEAPGRDEDLQGQPFVGASGQLLTKIIEAIGFDRRHVFICNILKCRPPQNRDPLPAEVQSCEPYLKRQLDIIQPKIICCLGRIAAQTLLGTDLSLGKLRRSVHFYQGIPVMATYHPAALLRNPDWKRDTWNDVQRLRALHDALDS